MAAIKNNIVVLDEDDVYYKNGHQRVNFYRAYEFFTGTLEITRKQENPFDLSSNIIERRSYKSGKLDGAREHFEQGKLIKIAHYKNNQLHGVCKAFDKYGKLRYRERFKNNQRHGVSKRVGRTGPFTFLPNTYEIFINGKDIFFFVPFRIKLVAGYFYFIIFLLPLLLFIFFLAFAVQGFLWIVYFVSEDLYSPLSSWTKRWFGFHDYYFPHNRWHKPKAK